MRDDKICRLTRHILSPQRVCTIAAHFVARRQIVHGGDEMCRQRRYNLSPATNCAGATKCAVTHHPIIFLDQSTHLLVANKSYNVILCILRQLKHIFFSVNCIRRVSYITVRVIIFVYVTSSCCQEETPS